MSARQSPPSASAATRSVRIFPGSCTARGARHRARPVARSVSSNSNAPAWDTIPRPSADTVILGRRTVFFTWKVPSARRGQDLRQDLSSQAKGTFYAHDAALQLFRRKPEANRAVVAYGLGMPARKGPPPQAAVTARRILLDGLARDADIFELVSELAPLPPRNN